MKELEERIKSEFPDRKISITAESDNYYSITFDKNTFRVQLLPDETLAKIKEQTGLDMKGEVTESIIQMIKTQLGDYD